MNYINPNRYKNGDFILRNLKLGSFLEIKNKADKFKSED